MEGITPIGTPAGGTPLLKAVAPAGPSRRASAAAKAASRSRVEAVETAIAVLHSKSDVCHSICHIDDAPLIHSHKNLTLLNGTLSSADIVFCQSRRHPWVSVVFHTHRDPS